MKRLVVGLVILIIIISLGVVGILYTDNFVSVLTRSLDLARESINAGSFEKAGKLCEDTKEHLEEKEKVLSLFLNHSLIEEIEETLSLLPDMAKEETKNAFLSSLEKVRTNLLELKESQKHIF